MSPRRARAIQYPRSYTDELAWEMEHAHRAPAAAAREYALSRRPAPMKDVLHTHGLDYDDAAVLGKLQRAFDDPKEDPNELDTKRFEERRTPFRLGDSGRPENPEGQTGRGDQLAESDGA